MKHTRIWIEYGPEEGERTFGHPQSCRERDTWCSTCGCCEHCFHDCDCIRCGCHDAVIIHPPRVMQTEDYTT